MHRARTRGVALVVTLVVAVAGLIGTGLSPASAEILDLNLTMVSGSGTWVVKGAVPGSTLPDPATLTGTIDSQTGQFSGATLSIPSWQEENQGSVQEFTIAQVNPSAVSGRIDSEANVTIDARLRVTIHILTPIDATCVTSPIDVDLASTAPYDPTSQVVTVAASGFTIPNFPATGSCPGVVTGPLNDQYAGSTGNAMTLTLAGSLPIPPPPGEPTTTTLDVQPVPGMTGQPSTLTATVASGGVTADDATGSVEFFDGPITLGSAPVVAGIATTSVSTLAASSHSLTARYSGDGQYETSTSVPVAYPVAAPPAFLATLPPIVVIDAPDPTEFTGVIANPANGQDLTGVRLDFTFQVAQQQVFAEQIIFEYQDGNGDWQPIVLTGTNTITGSFGGAAGFPLAVDEEQTIPFRIAVGPSPSGSTSNGTLTVTAALVLVDGGGDVLTTLSSVSGPMILTDDDRVPTTMNATINNGGGAQVQGLFLPANATLMPQPNQSGPYTGTGQVLLDGEPVFTKAMTGPSNITADLDTTDWAVGPHTVQFVYSGDAVHSPAQSAFLPIEILPRAGTLYHCAVTGSGTSFTAAYDLSVLANLASSALPGTEIPVSDLLIAGTGDGRTSASVPPTLVSFGLAPEGSGDAPDGMLTQITSGPLAGTLDSTLRIAGGAGTAVVDGSPGDVVLVGLSNLTYQINVAGIFVFDYDCTPVGFPAVIGEVTIAGATLTADPAGSATEGEPTVLTATVAPSSSQGSVSFFANGEDILGTAPVIGGTATLPVSLPVGEHTVTAMYSGDLVNPSSISEPMPYEVIALVEAAPDAGIRVAEPGGQFKGFGVVNDTGKGQTQKNTAAPGVSRSFRFSVDNIGELPGAFTLDGIPDANPSFRIKYYDQADNNITGQVAAGTYLTEVVDGDQRSQVFKIRIKPRGSASVGTKVIVPITVESDDGSVDVIRARLKTV